MNLYSSKTHGLDEEYERREEAEQDQDEMTEEVTRLKALFQDISLLTRDALGGN